MFKVELTKLYLTKYNSSEMSMLNLDINLINQRCFLFIDQTFAAQILCIQLYFFSWKNILQFEMLWEVTSYDSMEVKEIKLAWLHDKSIFSCSDNLDSYPKIAIALAAKGFQ